MTKLEIVHTELDQLHQELVNLQPPLNLGRLTAEAVQASYTAAAKAVEALQEPLLARAAKLEAGTEAAATTA